MHPTARSLSTLATLAFLTASAHAAPVQVFATDFEAGLPPEFSAPGSVITGVQGYAGLGPAGRRFNASFLRYTSVPIYPTTLVVRGLPPHDHLSVKFLLGLIDSWDGTELMQVSVDGVMKFSHWFQLASGDTTDYFPAPPGAILSMGTDLGFSGCCWYNRDRAYDLGAEPAFLDIPHTADTVAVVWSIGAVSGPAADQWQGGDDESWAIDAVRIEVEQQNAGVESDFAAGRLGLVGVAPNPSHGRDVSVSFSLPATAPARIELLDVSGRRLASREVGSFGRGTHVTTLNTARLAPGVYLVRLSQGAAARTTRVVLLE